MTIAPHVPAADVEDAAQACVVVREAGLRLTAARRLLLEALFAADGPVSAERLARETASASPGDVASTYRNLEVFEQLGLIRHMHLGHGPGLYTPAGGPPREYLVCERCSAVLSVDAAELEPLRASVLAKYSFEPRFTHFPLMGLCADCATAARRGEGSPEQSESKEAEMDHHHGEHDHEHDAPHAHEHEHDGETHAHAHTDHDHEHTEHDHEHSHGDVVHSHPHAHEKGLEQDHEHSHDPEQAEEGDPAGR